jgi:hypothetical protein
MTDLPPRIATRVLLAVLLLGAALRVWGIRFGLPHPLTRPDEEIVALTAAGFFKGDFNPHFFNWPSFYFYVIHGLLRVAYVAGRLTGRYADVSAFAQSEIASPSSVILMDRFVSVICGVMTLAVVHRLTRALFDRETALVATFFLAVAFLHVRDSHFGMLDVPLTLLIMFSIWCLVEGWSRGHTISRFVLAGVCAGLATSVKYNAAALAGAAIVVAALRLTERPRLARRSTWVGVVGFAVAFAAGFLAGTPYAVLDFTGFVHGVTFEARHFTGGHGLIVNNGWLQHLNFSLRYGLGLPLLVTGVVGLGALAVVNWRAALVLFAFPVLYYAVIGRGGTAFVRYAIPLVPFLCVSAAAFLQQLANRVGKRGLQHAVLLIAALAVAAPSIASVVRFDDLLTRRDTRLLAADWLAAQMAKGASLYESGPVYVKPDLSWPAEYRGAVLLVEFAEDRAVFLARAGSPRLPDWIVIAESPLRLYTTLPAALPAILGNDYVLAQRIGASRDREHESWFDRQDAFFLPFANFSLRIRPGPDYAIYRRRPTTTMAPIR